MAKPITKIRTVNDRHSTGKEKKKVIDKIEDCHCMASLSAVCFKSLAATPGLGRCRHVGPFMCGSVIGSYRHSSDIIEALPGGAPMSLV